MRRCEDGFAVVVVLIAVVAIGAFATLGVARVRTLAAADVLERNHARALQAAIGGVEQARYELKRRARWSGGDLMIGPTRVGVGVVRSGRLWHVSARARGAARVVVEADLVRRGKRIVVRHWRELP